MLTPTATAADFHNPHATNIHQQAHPRALQGSCRLSQRAVPKSSQPNFKHMAAVPSAG